jgi:predicted MPP superfamily phosphohydrolase
MFHTIIFLAYTIPGLYLFLRIWQFYSDKEYRFLYMSVFGFLYAIYPLSTLFDESGSGTIGKVILDISNYLIPFFLNLFLLVLIIDILLLINLVIRIIPGKKIRERTFRNRMLIFIISLSGIIVVAGVINFNTIRTTEYQIVVPGRSSDISSLKIAFISDFHLQEKTPAAFVERFVEKIGKIKPDLLLYGGDIVEGFSESENVERFEKILRSIETKYGVYGVRGNHDRVRNGNTSYFFTGSGITILNDSTVLKEKAFALAGRKDISEGRRKSAGEIMEYAPDNLPVIVIDHRPTEIQQLSQTRADIVFSGHTHHGQLFPINLITKSVYELSYGHMKKGGTHFFVSSGIRLWGPPVRTIAKSEILIVDIIFSGAK